MPTISLWAMMSSNRAGRYFSIHGSDARTRPLGFSTSPSMILGDNNASNHNPLEKPVPRMACLRAASASALVCRTLINTGTKWRGSLFEHVWPVTHLGSEKNSTWICWTPGLLLLNSFPYRYLVINFQTHAVVTCHRQNSYPLEKPNSIEFASTSRCRFCIAGCVPLKLTRSPLKEWRHETLPNRFCKKPAVWTLAQARSGAQLGANCRFRSFQSSISACSSSSSSNSIGGQSVVEGVNAFDGDVNSV